MPKTALLSSTIMRSFSFSAPLRYAPRKCFLSAVSHAKLSPAVYTRLPSSMPSNVKVSSMPLKSFLRISTVFPSEEMNAYLLSRVETTCLSLTTFVVSSSVMMKNLPASLTQSLPSSHLLPLLNEAAALSVFVSIMTSSPSFFSSAILSARSCCSSV